MSRSMESADADFMRGRKYFSNSPRIKKNEMRQGGDIASLILGKFGQILLFVLSLLYIHSRVSLLDE